MDVILIPGFWLDASCWQDVAPVLESAGHRVHALTLPGLESRDADRSDIRLKDHVDAVVSEIDGTSPPVVLVGHSGGGPIAHAAADARPDRVTRVIHVDTFPLGVGLAINDELPVVGGEIPLPDWSAFDEADLRDLDETSLDGFRARAIPQPAAVSRDPQVLNDARRYEIPATVIACEFSREQLETWMAEGEPYVAELAAMRDVEYVELPTGHWPQFSRPAELARAIVAAIDRG